MDKSLKALDSLLGELDALEVPKALCRPRKAACSSSGAANTFVDNEQYYLESDPHAVKVQKLKEKIAELKGTNTNLVSRFGPSLRRRVALHKLMGKPNSYLRQTIGVGGWIRTTRYFPHNNVAFCVFQLLGGKFWASCERFHHFLGCVCVLYVETEKVSCLSNCSMVQSLTSCK